MATVRFGGSTSAGRLSCPDLQWSSGLGAVELPCGTVAAALLCAAVVGILPGGRGAAFAQTTIGSATLTVGAHFTDPDVVGWQSVTA